MNHHYADGYSATFEDLDHLLHTLNEQERHLREVAKQSTIRPLGEFLSGKAEGIELASRMIRELQQEGMLP